MTRRNALEFARDVADAFKAASGIDVQEAIDLFSQDLAGYDLDANHREAVIRELFSSDLTEIDATRLLSLRPKASEAETFARAILTSATWMFRRHPAPHYPLLQLAKISMLSFLIFLRPEGSSYNFTVPPTMISMGDAVH